MNVRRTVVVWVLRLLTRAVCRIDAVQLDRVPPTGPLIIAMNHVNILEVPIIFTQLYPRPVSGLVRSDAWDNRLWRFVLNACEAIPIRRGEADLGGLRRGLHALEAGRIVVIAPEGTRSHDGRLQKAHAGVVFLAERSGAPVLPVACYGSEGFRSNLQRLRRTDFHIRVGDALHVEGAEGRSRREARGRAVDEVMARVAALLPREYRGAYVRRPVSSEGRDVAAGA